MVTKDDLDWWLAIASRVDWIWAKTYAQTAPHEYIVEGRTTGLTRQDYVRAARVIHTFGQPAKFYGMTNLYLTSPDRRLKWWTMDQNITATCLINQATTERNYGVQNAPVTTSGVTTPYDAVATEYDADHPTPDDVAAALHEVVATLTGDRLPAILDVGCGTGRVLDLGLTTPDRYVGVDPSAPMLNQLVRKHPRVGAIYPMTIEQALGQDRFTPGQFEIVTMLLDESQALARETFAAVRTIASRALVTVIGRSICVLENGGSFTQ
jgi:hypothetical protein